MASGSRYWVSGVTGRGRSLTVAGLDSPALQMNVEKPEKLSDLSEVVQMGSGRCGVRRTRAMPAPPFGALETFCHGKEEIGTEMGGGETDR